MTQTSLTEQQLWLAISKPVLKPRLRLFCFPYAGSGPVVYHQWTKEMPPDVEVCGVRLPGRETRLREPAFTSLPPLVEELGEALRPFTDIPFAIFGHSMGALVGFELVRYWRDQGGPQPVHLLASGHRAPHRPPLNPPVHQADKQVFLNRLKGLGGTPAQFFAMDELVDLMLPTLRADFSVWETYQYQEKPPLALPLTVFGGYGDSEAAEADFTAWEQHTGGAFTLYMFAGGHFYFRDDASSLLRFIRNALS